MTVRRGVKVKVADVVVRYRTVTVPDRCKHCKKSLTGPKALFVARLEHVFYEAVKSTQAGPVPKEIMQDPASKEFELWEQCPVENDCWTYIACGHCGNELVDSKSKRVSPEEKPLEESLQDSVWSAAIDQVILS